MEGYNLTVDRNCSDRVLHLPTAIHTSIIPAIGITIALAFLHRRRHKCVRCCSGRPALFVPINLVDDDENRWSYAFAFGAITNTIVMLFTGGQYFDWDGEVVSKVAVGMLSGVEICLCYLPLFACLATTHKFLGSMLGFLYATGWFIVILGITLECGDPVPNILPNIGWVIQTPCLLCLGFLVLKYLRSCLESAFYRSITLIKPEHLICNSYHRSYVQNLLSPPQEPPKSTCKKYIMLCWNKYILKDTPYFMYSTRVVCTIFVVFMCTYQMGVLYYWVNASFLSWVNANAEIIFNVTENVLPANSTLIDDLRLGLSLIGIFFDIVTLVGLIFFTINILAILFAYRSDVLSLYRGNKDFLPPRFEPKSAEMLRGCMLFAGLQIAYMIWGFFIANFVLWIIALLFLLIVVFPLIRGVTSVISWLAQVFIIPGIISFALRTAQVIMADLVFLQDKFYETDEDKPLALNNRRLYHIFDYFFFIANIQIGLFSCLFRILKSFIYGLIYIGRTDKCLLMPGMEQGDRGYMSYVGMVYVDHCHNNPVMRVFSQYLIDTLPERDEEGESDVDAVLPQNAVKPVSYRRKSEGLFSKYERSQLARRRWFVAYTLIHNPELKSLRKYQLEKEIELKMKMLEFLSENKLYSTLDKAANTLSKSILGDTEGDSAVKSEVEKILQRKFQRWLLEHEQMDDEQHEEQVTDNKDEHKSRFMKLLGKFKKKSEHDDDTEKNINDKSDNCFVDLINVKEADSTTQNDTHHTALYNTNERTNYTDNRNCCTQVIEPGTTVTCTDDKSNTDLNQAVDEILSDTQAVAKL